jgi:hypothetical protein
MTWAKLQFGKHKGKTLPQVLFTDPDWFFWAYDEEGVRERLGAEGAELYRRATRILIPQEGPEELVAEYVIHPDGTFADLNIIPKSRPAHEGGSPTVRYTYIDLSFPRRLRGYDKLGCKMLVAALKGVYFGDTKARMTQQRCEKFFEDKKNFLPHVP